QVEREDGVVGRDLPARRQALDDGGGLDPGLVADEPLVHVGGQREPVARVVDVRVRRLADVAQQPEAQHPVGGGGRRGGGSGGGPTAAAEQQHRGDRAGEGGARAAGG